MKPVDEQNIEKFTVRLKTDSSELANRIARRIGIPKSVFLRICIENELKLRASITDVAQLRSR